MIIPIKYVFSCTQQFPFVSKGLSDGLKVHAKILAITLVIFGAFSGLLVLIYRSFKATQLASKPTKVAQLVSKSTKAAQLASKPTSILPEALSRRIEKKSFVDEEIEEELEIEPEDPDDSKNVNTGEETLLDNCLPSDQKIQPIDVSSLAPDSVSNQKEATYHILATPGFFDDGEGVPSQYGTKGEIQGSKALRYTVAKVTKQFPQAISPEALRAQREVNLEQYLTIKLKRFGHAFTLKGLIPLPSGKQVNLEGFCEAFTVPMLASSFETYSKQSTFFSTEDFNWIIQQFNETTSSDHTEPDDIQVLTCMLQDPNFLGPICLGTGHHWHSTAAIFFGNFLIHCNRGWGDNSAGIHIYALPNRSLLTEGVIWEMTKRQEISRNAYFGTTRIEKQLEGVLVHYEPLSPQGAGNCTLVSMETALFVFMLIRQALNVFGEQKILREDCLDSNAWQDLFKNVTPEYQNWWNRDREHILQDLTEEMKEWLEKTSNFSQHTLYKTYYALATAWEAKYLVEEPLPGKSLSNLIHPLMEKVKDLNDF